MFKQFSKQKMSVLAARCTSIFKTQVLRMFILIFEKKLNFQLFHIRLTAKTTMLKIQKGLNSFTQFYIEITSRLNRI